MARKLSQPVISNAKWEKKNLTNNEFTLKIILEQKKKLTESH